MKKNESVLFPLFSSPLFCIKVDIDNKKILNHLIKLKYRDTSMSDGSFISLSNKILENKNLKKEKNIFLDNIKKYLEILDYSKGYKIFNSWSTKTNINSSSHLHAHQNSWLSGVYYPECDEGFSISFHRNHLSGSFHRLDYDNQNNIYSCEQFKVKPNENILLLFPSEVFHKINKNTSNKVRYSLAFNINPVGLFQKGTDLEREYN